MKVPNTTQILGGIFVCFLPLMVACGTGAVPVEAPAEANLPDSPTATDVTQPTATTPKADTPMPAVLPTDTPEKPEQVAVDQCVACHQDKDQLIDTAKPEEEVISENKGEG